MKKANHNQRSKRHLLANGYSYVEVTERWDSWAKRKHDLMGFCDMLALAPDAITAVQVTSKAHLSDRAKKIVGECGERAKAWLAAGGKILLLGWEKEKGRWKPTERKVSISDFVEGSGEAVRERSKQGDTGDGCREAHTDNQNATG